MGIVAQSIMLAEKIVAYAEDKEQDVEKLWDRFVGFLEQELTGQSAPVAENAETAPAEATPVESPAEVFPEKGDLLPQEAPVESATESASVEPVAQ